MVLPYTTTVASTRKTSHKLYCSHKIIIIRHTNIFCFSFYCMNKKNAFRSRLSDAVRSRFLNVHMKISETLTANSSLVLTVYVMRCDIWVAKLSVNFDRLFKSKL